MAGDPQTTAILATLLGLLGVMISRDIRDRRYRINGNGGPTAALAEERHKVLEKLGARAVSDLGALDDLAKGSFLPAHVALAKATETHDELLRSIRDACLATSAGVGELVEYQRKH